MLSWDFTYIEPQLYGFMNATYGKNHSVVINFSTQPTWLYDTTDWSYPSDPNAVDWSYPRGAPVRANIPKLAQYYGRLLSWLMRGSFTDENGQVHGGGPAYEHLQYWEVFNEAEHGYDVATYTETYDAVVAEIRRAADPGHTVQFVGIGGADPAWIPYFLNRSNHGDPDVPLDWVSIHFYSTSSTSRSDPAAFEAAFFSDADGFIENMRKNILPARAALSPITKLDLDELGVILPDDNDPNAPPISEIYWNAAGAMYAYLFAKLAPEGVETLGHSQFCGSPQIPVCCASGMPELLLIGTLA